MAPIVPLVDALAFLGEVSDPGNKVAILLAGISDQIRRLTRRAYEGAGTVYDEDYRLDGYRQLTLRHVPLESVLAVRRIYFDGSEDPIATPRDVSGGASTTLAAAAIKGATNLKLVAMTGLAIGDQVRVGSGTAMEVVRVTSVGTAGAGGTGAGIEPALRYGQAVAGAVVEVAGSEAFRVESAARGRIRINFPADLLRVTHRVSGITEDRIIEACYDWLKVGWEQLKDNPPDSQELASQSSDAWSESYVQDITTSITRRPPPKVVLALAGSYHATGGGPI